MSSFHNSRHRYLPNEESVASAGERVEARIAAARPSALGFEPLLDAVQAAALVRMHPKTLKRKAEHKEIPAYHIGRRWFFRASELDEWLRMSVHSAHHPCRVERREQ